MAGFQIVDGKWHHAPVARKSRSRGTMPALRRSFAAGKVDDLTYSFSGSHNHINEELRQSLRRIRARSRQLCMDNDYAKKFIHVVKANVVGVNGIVLQSRAVDAKGDLDTYDNNLIENGWKDWGKPYNCTVSGQHSWHDVQSLIIGSIARDGEVLVQLIEKASAPYGFVLRIFPAEYLDENDNRTLPGGHKVVMGVEYDADEMVVAYHIRKEHPGAYRNVYRSTEYRRISAKNMIHLFVSEYPEQARGIPWMHTAIRRLNMLGGYEEAELIAARIGASKMGFFTSPEGDGPTPSQMAPDGMDGNDHELIDEVTPGMIENLPEGYGFQSFNADHPSTAYDAFTKAVLRGATAGLNVAYSSVANDLTDVNFSSIRAGVIDERDQWKMLHRFMITHLCERVYNRWLPMAIMRKKLPLPFKKIDTKYQSIYWQPRGWPWVDPYKDSKANSENISMAVDTRTDIAAASGKDFKDVIDQLAYEEKLAAAAGVDITPIGKQSGGNNAADLQQDD